jgi:hypothetical protein
METRPEVDVAPLSHLMGVEYLFDIPLRSHQIQPSTGHCEKNWEMLQKKHRAICGGVTKPFSAGVTGSAKYYRGEQQRQRTCIGRGPCVWNEMKKAR